MRVLAIVMLLPALAYGEPAKHQTTFDIKVDDPSGGVTSAAVTAAIGASVDGCWRKPGRMKAKLVLDKGVATVADASGSGDPVAEACVRRALNGVTLANVTGRTVVEIQLVAVALQALFETKNRKVLDRILDTNLNTNLGKFVGLSGQGSGGNSTGLGTTKAGKVPPASVSHVDMIPHVDHHHGSRPVGYAPSVKIDLSAPTGNLGNLTADEIGKVLGTRTGLFRACYERERARGSQLGAGSFAIELGIAADGAVTRAAFDPAKSTLATEPIGSCLVRQLGHMKFPSKGAAASIAMSIGFAPIRVVPLSPPPAKIDEGLGANEINRPIKANAAAFKACYKAELDKQPGLSGKVVVRFRIEANGSVSSASVASSTLPSPAVGTCIAARIRGLKFPAKVVANVTYPFIFTAGG